MANSDRPRTRVRSVLEDPSSRAIARVYANAFLDAAAALGQLDEAMDEFDSFLEDVLRPNPEFEQMLLSGIISRQDKIGLVDRVVGPQGSELFTNFLRVVAKHDRLDLLPLIFGESHQAYDARLGRKRVQVKSAIPLSEGALAKIAARLGEVFSITPVLEPAVDPSLLGGLVIQIDHTVYDSSLRTRIKQLRGRLRERSLHEIQSRRDRFSSPEGN